MEQLKKVLEQAGKICKIVFTYMMKFLKCLFSLVKTLWKRVLIPLAKKIRALPWKEWANRFAQFLKTNPYARPVLAGLLVVILVLSLCLHFFGRKTDKSVPEISQESVTAEATAITEEADTEQAP